MTCGLLRSDKATSDEETTKQDALPPRTSDCNSHEQIRTDIGFDSAYPLLCISFAVWILNLFDAGRAKAHFESRQRSTCRPDSPSSNLAASTADCDGVRSVRRRDRWLPPLDQKLPTWSRFRFMVGSPCSTAHCAQLCLLHTKFVSSGTLHAAVPMFGIRILFNWYSSS